MRKSVTMSLIIIGINTGCVTTQVNDNQLQLATQRSLGIENMKISNKKNDGVTTYFKAQDHDNDITYSCYVTSLGGTNVSDAICNQKGKPAKNPLLR